MAKLPDSLEGILDDLGRGLKVLDDRAEGYEKGAAYYNGDVSEIITSAKLRLLLKNSAEAHKLVFAAIPVDALMDKVELANVTAKDASANAALEVVWDENSLDDEADEWHKKAGYYGDYYAILDPQEEDPQGAVTKLRAVGSSPLSTVMVYSSEDDRTALFAVKRWKVGKSWRANVFYQDGVASLETIGGNAQASDASKFFPLLADEEDEESYIQPHPGDKIPVIHYAVDGKPYGTPVHVKAYGPQDAITKLNASHMATTDYQIAPQRYALQEPGLAVGDDDIDDDFGDNGLAVDPNDNGQDKAVGENSKLRGDPGSVWIMRGIKAMGQFDPADHKPFLEGEEWFVRAMAVTTGTPLFEFDLHGDQPSGAARRAASGRINKHARKVKRTLGASWVEFADTVLALMGKTSEVVANWLPTETETDADGLALVSAKVKAGVPVRAALLEAGYTTEQVDEWYPKGSPAVTPELWSMLATALQQLGAAETLGTISQREIGNMFPDILTEARDEGLTPPPPPAPTIVAGTLPPGAPAENVDPAAPFGPPAPVPPKA